MIKNICRFFIAEKNLSDNFFKAINFVQKISTVNSKFCKAVEL